MGKDSISQFFRAALRGVDDNDVPLWAARVVKLVLEQREGVFTLTRAARASRRPIDARPLAFHRIPLPQTLVEEADVLDPALDIPVAEAELFGERGSRIEALLVVARAVDDDVQPLPQDVLGERPLQAVCAFGYLDEFRVVLFLEEGGPEDVMIDDEAAERFPEEI